MKAKRQGRGAGGVEALKGFFSPRIPFSRSASSCSLSSASPDTLAVLLCSSIATYLRQRRGRPRTSRKACGAGSLSAANSRDNCLWSDGSNGLSLLVDTVSCLKLEEIAAIADVYEFAARCSESKILQACGSCSQLQGKSAESDPSHAIKPGTRIQAQGRKGTESKGNTAQHPEGGAHGSLHLVTLK